MSQANGQLLPLDPAILTTNDLKRVKAKLNGRSPSELMNEAETLWQVLMLAVKLRTDPEFTFEQAGDVPLGEVFDVSGGQSPPDQSPGSPAGTSGGSPSRSTAPRSGKRRPGSAAAKPSATTSA